MSSLTALPRRRPLLLRRFAGATPVATVAMAILLLIIVAAVLAPLVAPHDPDAVDLLDSYAPPSSAHVLGTDASGRDILSRLIYGARVSLSGPALVVLLTVPVGALLALASAWFGGFVDAAISRFVEVLFAFPGLILAVISVALFGAGFWAPVIALSISYVPLIARILRSVAISERKLPYVAALQIQGVSGLRIAVRHILPNLMPMITVQAGIGFAYAMLDLAAISYLGLGLQPPTADWGVMVADGQSSVVEGFPQESLFAALIVLVTVVSLNLVSGWLAERYDISQGQP